MPQPSQRGFNPYRVFKFVATPGIWIDDIQLDKFQSLSGFQVRCNIILSAQVHGLRDVSIPIGFSSSLQPPPSAIMTTAKAVSIPIGFSSSLQLPFSLFLHNVLLYVSIPIGFSSSLQPHFLYSSIMFFSMFQSLSGFQVRCNPVRSLREKAVRLFQSLSGFQVRCNNLRSLSPGRTRATFQSLSGFQVRCNFFL